MDITEVRVRLVDDRNERLKAFCCMTIDDEFVVRDIKIIDGAKGLFVAMPSRKITDHCPQCSGKNPLRASYCNECGGTLKGGKFDDAETMGDKLHADVAHPINSECRARISKAVIAAYKEELGRSEEPDYQPASDVPDDECGDDGDEYAGEHSGDGIMERVPVGGDTVMDSISADVAPTEEPADEPEASPEPKAPETPPEPEAPEKAPEPDETEQPEKTEKPEKKGGSGFSEGIL